MTGSDRKGRRSVCKRDAREIRQGRVETRWEGVTINEQTTDERTDPNKDNQGLFFWSVNGTIANRKGRSDHRGTPFMSNTSIGRGCSDCSGV